MRTEQERDHERGRDREDRDHGDDHHPVQSHDHGGGDDPKTVTIYVNTRPHEVAKEEISFEEVVKLAYPTTPPGANIGYTVTYQRGHGNKDGDLVAGQTVKVKDGMIFDVTATDLS
jgi:hypothetical protein